MQSLFNREAAEGGINAMKSASENQAQNASDFQNKLSEMQNGVFKGTISEKFYSSANQHAENLKTESNNTKELANGSDAAKNIFAELAESIKSRLG